MHNWHMYDDRQFTLASYPENANGRLYVAFKGQAVVSYALYEALRADEEHNILLSYASHCTVTHRQCWWACIALLFAFDASHLL
jgi:hypothetical protein